MRLLILLAFFSIPALAMAQQPFPAKPLLYDPLTGTLVSPDIKPGAGPAIVLTGNSNGTTLTLKNASTSQAPLVLELVSSNELCSFQWQNQSGVQEGSMGYGGTTCSPAFLQGKMFLYTGANTFVVTHDAATSDFVMSGTGAITLGSLLTTSAGISNTGTISTTGPLNSTAAQTVVAASGSGTVTFSQALAGGSLKLVTAHFSAATGTATYVFPTAFTTTPTELDGASLFTTIGTGTATVTGSATTGNAVLIGY